jgi:hypothetical protein
VALTVGSQSTLQKEYWKDCRRDSELSCHGDQGSCRNWLCDIGGMGTLSLAHYQEEGSGGRERPQTGIGAQHTYHSIPAL